MSIRPRTLSSSLMLSSALVLTLAACKPDDRPLAAAEPLFVPADSAAYEMSVAPGWSDLPAYQASVGRPLDDGYGYAERAYAVDRAFYQSPPDYAFAYDDAQPWVWETEDDWLMYVEPLAAGYRYYYYEPGEIYPYFVRDPDYGYGYDDGGLLVVVYDSRGSLLPTTYVTRYADRGGRYLGRARALRGAAAHARRVSIPEERWVDRRSAFVGDQANWFEAAQRQPDWKRYRDKHEAKDLRRFERERERRAISVARLDRVEARQGGRNHDARRVASLESPPREIVERERAERRAERPERFERQVRLDDRKSERQVRDDQDRERRSAVERRREVAPAATRVERQARNEDRKGPAREAQQRADRRAAPQAASEVAPVERQARREERGPERQAAVPRPERQVKVERQARREDRAPERQAAAPRPERQVKVERQARREDRGPERQAAAPRPERQAKAERPKPTQARDAGRAGKDAAARERGGGKDRDKN